MASDIKRIFLTPLCGKIAKKPIFAFDVESTGEKNRFFCVSIVGSSIDRRTKKVKSIKETFLSQLDFVAYLDNNLHIFKGAYIFATNLAFDIGVLAKGQPFEAEFLGNAVYRGTSMIALKYHGMVFLDTMSFARISVADQGKFLGIEKMLYPAYISENREPYMAEYDYIYRYNVQDCEISCAFANYIQDSFNALGCKLKYTIASCAMDLFRRKYLKEWILKPSDSTIVNLRKAYYGGRTEAFRRGKIENVNYYDFNSMYPSVMRNELPDTKYQRYAAGHRPELLKYEGVSECGVVTPKDMKIPFLPYRYGAKLLFPIGDFAGWYSHVELRKAISLGYKITLKRTIYYLRTQPFLKDYATDLYKKRQDNRKTPLEYAIKLLLNALYGKFSERDGKDELKHVSQVNVDSDDFTQILGSDYVLLRQPHNPQAKKHVNVIWGVYITAYARIKLYEKFERLGLENIYYCDTDSIITCASIPDSKELGELKLEKHIVCGIIIRPKVYAADDSIRVKGFNMKNLNFSDILNRHSLRQRQFIGIRRAIKSKKKYEIGEVIYFDKNIRLEDEKREWESACFSSVDIQDSRPLCVCDGVLFDRERHSHEIAAMKTELYDYIELSNTLDKGSDISRDEFIRNEYFNREI